VLVRTGVEARARQAQGLHPADPVLLELFNNLFMNVAEQMGAVLQNTSTSVNMRERLDFSCAIFDRADSSSRMRRTCRSIWAPWGRAFRP
jgi:5-oxoprolinase (ATP-hydrolysing)